MSSLILVLKNWSGMEYSGQTKRKRDGRGRQININLVFGAIIKKIYVSILIYHMNLQSDLQNRLLVCTSRKN